jgi:hypothetical protein
MLKGRPDGLGEKTAVRGGGWNEIEKSLCFYESVAEDLMIQR